MIASRRDLRHQLFQLAAEQGGYFTAAQARKIGYSYQAQAHNVHAGNWVRLNRGMFRLVEWIPELHDDLIRWTLWSGGQAVVSHESALAVHGISELESSRLRLTVPPGFSLQNPAVTLYHNDVPDKDILQLAGFRVTTVIRSLIDVAAILADEDQLKRAVQEALDSGVFTLRQLRSRAEEVDLRAALRIERALVSVSAL
ncbi:MAG: hypothetical protein DLM55_04280 [Acidimicrobiales bacterium]|nr:MAG: hypothetical protein DLM55_04280 [Acidimicrobiales bacterium]